MPAPHSKAKRAAVAERRARAIDLRLAGVDMVTIGRTLHYGRWSGDGTPDENGVQVWGEQVSSDDSIARMVRQDIDRGFQDRRRHLHDSAEEHVRQSVERLDRLRAALWGKALQGSVPAVRECARIEAQLAHLNGWNKPVRHEVDLPDMRRELEEAVEELARLAEQGAPLRPVEALREG